MKCSRCVHRRRGQCPHWPACNPCVYVLLHVSEVVFQLNLPFGQVKFRYRGVKLLRSEIFADANVGKFHFTFRESGKFHNSQRELFHRGVATISLKRISKVGTNNSKTPDFFVKTGVFFIQSYPAGVTRRA